MRGSFDEKIIVNITVENLAPCKKLLRVELDAKAVDEAFDAMTKNYQKQAALPGFRPGKAPREMVLKKYETDIKEDGTITMPDIGHVQAAGKTAGELQNEIYNLYVPKLYRHLTVTVNTGDRVYYVTGEVKQPARQLYSGQMTVTKAITTAGDFTDFANHKKVLLTRANGQRIKVNCDKIQAGKAVDPFVYPNDQIQVPRRIW